MALRAPFACLLAGLATLLSGVAAYQVANAREEDGRELTLPLFVARNFYSDDLRRQEKLNHFQGVLAARVGERRRLIERLAAGRITLFEAAAEFKRLNALPQPSAFDILELFPGASPNECVCRQVITWLTSNLRDLPPSQRQLVLDRVEADLRDHIARNGTVILPGD